MIEPTPGFPVFITAETVAPMLGIETAHTFMLKRRALEDEQGFPPPCAYLRRPLKWHRETVEHWLRRQAEAAAAAVDDAVQPEGDATPPTRVIPITRPLASIDGGRT